MVNERTYAPTLAETASGNIRTACDALSAATGLSETLISYAIKGDRAFLMRLSRNAMNVRSYDEAMGRLSAIWPEEVEWPAAVPRPAPVPLSDDMRADYELALLKARAARAEEAAREAKRIAREAASSDRRAARGSTAGGNPAPAHA